MITIAQDGKSEAIGYQDQRRLTVYEHESIDCHSNVLQLSTSDSDTDINVYPKVSLIVVSDYIHQLKKVLEIS